MSTDSRASSDDDTRNGTPDRSTENSEEDEETEDERKRKELEETDDAEKEEFPPKPLDSKLIRESLSVLARIGSGLAHAYVRLDLHDRELTDLSIVAAYIHLRFLDVSGNHVKDASPLSPLTALLWLNADHNALSTVDVDELPHLQAASFRDNRLTSLADISHPTLDTLSLAANQIERLDWTDVSRLQALRVLDLKDNRLTSTEGLIPPNLEELYLAGNGLTSIVGLEVLPKLRVIHLRSNHISCLEGFPRLQTLEYLNLRGNDISDFTQLTHLSHLQRLRVLVLKDNTLVKLDDYRVQAIAQLIDCAQLRRLDKDTCTNAERRDARAWLLEMAEEAAQEEEQEEEVEEEQELVFDSTADTDDTEEDT